jgi:hypothetical protein
MLKMPRLVKLVKAVSSEWLVSTKAESAPCAEIAPEDAQKERRRDLVTARRRQDDDAERLCRRDKDLGTIIIIIIIIIIFVIVVTMITRSLLCWHARASCGSRPAGTSSASTLTLR